MKTIISIVLCCLSFSFSAEASNDKQITFGRLPKQSQQLINKFFANQPIALVKMDSELFDQSYEVIFTNGNKIDFDKKGRWTEIDCKYTHVPAEVIPIQIQKHVATKYPNEKICQIEKESRKNLEVKLTNNLKLTFDPKYNLVDIDN